MSTLISEDTPDADPACPIFAFTEPRYKGRTGCTLVLFYSGTKTDMVGLGTNYNAKDWVVVGLDVF
ncbi:MAG: hypothetical protein Q9181_002655 [Wetmoreana brouardii]